MSGKTTSAIHDCAEWLRRCLELGWRKEDLDFLEGLWWEYHDDYGNRTPRAIEGRQP